MGTDSWVVEVLEKGYQIFLQVRSPLSEDLILFESYSPTFVKGKALIGEISTSAKGNSRAISCISRVLQLHVCGSEGFRHLAFSY